MCGRYGLVLTPDQIQVSFDVKLDPSWIFPRYNIAPTQDVLAITLRDGQRAAEMLAWGLVPHWAKDKKTGYSMINARAESVVEKPTFKQLFKNRRCLIAADRFYEWKGEGKDKAPFSIGMKGFRPFTMAGLWTETKLPGEELVRSCTIITTDANQFMTPIHNRMPVILPKDAESTWLATNTSEGELRELLIPYDSSDMEAYEVSRLVNSPKNQSAAVVAPVTS
ncbi:MAG: SOS response-associated peptidase [SAR202 cluster bacterium]|nr:SOS response-associated peptidase [SAR202 cluster bacterium]